MTYSFAHESGNDNWPTAERLRVKAPDPNGGIAYCLCRFRFVKTVSGKKQIEYESELETSGYYLLGAEIIGPG